MPSLVNIGIRGWAGRIPILSHVSVLPCVFVYTSHRVLAIYRWTDYDARWLIGRVFRISPHPRTASVLMLFFVAWINLDYGHQLCHLTLLLLRICAQQLTTNFLLKLLHSRTTILLHAFLPSGSTASQRYSLRRSHSFQLRGQPTRLSDRNFLTRIKTVISFCICILSIFVHSLLVCILSCLLYNKMNEWNDEWMNACHEAELSST